MATPLPISTRCWSLVLKSNAPKKGRNENVSTLFHVSSHAVTGRLACFTVVPLLLNRKVTPPPE